MSQFLMHWQTGIMLKESTFVQKVKFYQIQMFVCNQVTSLIDTVQKFLIKLGIKPLMHLLEISIFFIDNDLVRLTKIMIKLVKDLKILSFKVIFQCLKLVESFQKKKFEKYLIRKPTYINEIF